MAQRALQPDRLALLVEVLAVVAAEAAGEVLVPDVIRERLPGEVLRLELGELEDLAASSPRTAPRPSFASGFSSPLGAASAMICSNFGTCSSIGPCSADAFSMIASARALIDGRLAVDPPSWIASSTRSAGLMNGWPDALWQSMQSIRRFGFWSISARPTLLGGVEVGRRLAVLAGDPDPAGSSASARRRVTYSTFCVDVPVDARASPSRAPRRCRCARQPRARLGALRRRCRSGPWCAPCRRGSPPASGSPRRSRAPGAACAP